MGSELHRKLEEVAIEIHQHLAKGQYSEAHMVLLRYMNKLLVNDRFDDCNEMIKTLDPVIKDHLSLGVGILRFSYPARDRIPAWYVLRDLMKDKVEDPERVLRGLLDLD